MRWKNRKSAVVALAIGAVLCIAFFFFGMYLTSYWVHRSEEFDGDSLFLEMQVGETYDLQKYTGEYGGQVKLTSNAYRNEVDGAVSLDAQGNLHALKAGIYRFNVSVTYDTALFKTSVKSLVSVDLLVHDYEFDDYKPVESYADLTGSPNGKYILSKDFTVRRDAYGEVKNFSGILANPEGHTIEVADDFPLFEEIERNSVVKGLCIKSDADGFHWQENDGTGMSGGMVAVRLNQYSVVCDCKVEADIYGDTSCNGYFESNSGSVLRCEFRGTRFGLEDDANIYQSFAIAAGGDIRDCTVYADGYRGNSRNQLERVSVFHAIIPSLISPPETVSFSVNGNRVFDLSGEHEIDFGKMISYKAVYRVSGPEMVNERRFPGCVAEFPVGMKELLESENAEYTGCTDSEGGTYSAEETCFLPDAENVLVEVDVRYRQTHFVETGSGRIDTIYPSESVVQLPEGKGLVNRISFGMFSPKEITLKLAADTQLQGDTLFLQATRAYTDEETMEIGLDLSASLVYEQRADGVYRTDNGMLCRYDKEISDGTMTIPDGVTQMSGDPFGPLVFEKLNTNDLAEIPYPSYGEWRGRVKTIRFGAAANLTNVWDPLNFFDALKTIETEERTDGYFAENGILCTESSYIYVPCAYAEGETILLKGKDIGKYALQRNLAEEIILEDVGKVEADAFYMTYCPKVIVRGSGTQIEKWAFNRCYGLTEFSAEGKVSLQSEAFDLCPDLQTIELNENFESVAYDAVSKCSSFAGYTRAEGCDKFTLSDGVLFVGGKALLPSVWMKEHETLVVPAGISDVQIFSENILAYSAFRTVLLNKDVQNISAYDVPVSAYALAQESSYLKVQDGVLFNADGTKLLAYPKNSKESSYTVPDSVNSIAARAFFGAEYLRRIAVGKNTEQIGAYAFSQTTLSEIEFGEALVGIGEYAFSTANLSEVMLALPQSLETIGNYAFYNSELHNVIWPSGLTEIPQSAFRYASIDEIILPEGLLSIGNDAFGWTEIERIELPESLLFIGEKAFACASLTEITLNKNLEEVGDRAFYNCKNLAAVTALGNAVAFGKECFEGTPFLAEGKTAENGAIYLGNTMLGLFGEGENVEVRNGTTEVKSLKSVNVKKLKLPATLTVMPSVEDLPYLEQLWIGVAPQGAEETVVDAGNAKFKAKSDHLYIWFPKHVTFVGSLGEDVYICYDGTPEEFSQYARLNNFNKYYDRVYYYSESDGRQTWCYDSGGNMYLRSKALSDGFTYEYSYDENGFCCTIVGYNVAYGSSVVIPKTDPRGLKISVVSGLCEERLKEVHIEGVDVYMEGSFNVERLYIAADCNVSVWSSIVNPTITYLFTDAAYGNFLICYDIENIVVGKNVQELYFGWQTKAYYEGTPEQWSEGEISGKAPYAYYSEDGNYPDDGNLYWKYEGGLPVLWN